MVTNNDILRRVRYAFDFDDSKMIALFSLGGEEATRAEVSDWLKSDDDPANLSLNDTKLISFLDGLIKDRRGEREGPPPPPVDYLNNNIILRKLKIALDLKDDDILDILQLADKVLSKHELSAFFRKPDNKHFRPCKDQVLRKFLQGMQIKYRSFEE